MAASAASDVTDGPVLNFINKRLRALRKKLNRITQMEEGIAQGKPINKEQEETLRTKPSITAAIDELEKLKQPLSVAVNEEIALAIERREAESKVKQTLEEEKSEQQQQTSQVEAVVPDDKTLFVQDLLNLIYFGSMFDVKSQNDFESIMLTRAHERQCCLAYDYVTDDDSMDMLGERDLDLISAMGSLLISRPGASSLSHQNALQRCIEHAKLWLEKSDQPIDVNSTVTYAELREKLTKIMGSNYFTITPEMKAPVDVPTAAAGNYASFQVPTQVDGSVAQYEHKDDEVVDYQGSETYDEQSRPLEELHKDEYDAENSVNSAQAGSDKSHSEAGVEYRDPQQAPRRTYQNQRGNGRAGGGGGGRRGHYSNGRGGRTGGRGGGGGGGGPYQNGRNQYYDQPGGYYQRSYSNNRGRGGGRGPVGNNFYNQHAAGVQVAES